MKKLLEFVISSIVTHPEEVSVTEDQTPEFSNYSIKAHQDDLKIIIGKNGRTIRAIRELAKIRAIKEKRKIMVNIEEN